VIAYSLAKPISMPEGCAKPADKPHAKSKQKPGEKKVHKPPFKACNPVTITITDGAGHSVANLRGPGKAGINDVAWNMHYTGIAKLPKSMREERSHESHEPDGPLALPGTYEAIVTANGDREKVMLQVTGDPRVDTPMATQRAAFDTGMRLRGEAAAMVAVIGRTHAMMDALDHVLASTSAAGSAKAGLHTSAATLKQRLAAFAVNLYNPNVQYEVPEDDLHQLAPFGMSFLGMARQASHMGPDQAPNAAQQQYIARMESKLQPLLDDFNGPLRQEVQAFNAQAKQSGEQPLPIGEPVKVGDPKLLAND
jgi:hypothetical protein